MLSDLTGLCCYVLAQQMQRASILDSLFDAFHGDACARVAPSVHCGESLEHYIWRLYDGPADMDELLALLLHRAQARARRRVHAHRTFLPFVACSATLRA